MSYLGIDLGTSGLRALLVDETGNPIGSEQRHYDVSHPHIGWSEQDPAAWISALEEVIQEMRNSYREFTQLRGIGVAGHMHGATLLDSAGNVLRPCILWNDTRSHIQATRLDNIKQMRDLSGNIVFPGFTAPKLEWVRENEPDIFDKTAKVLLPAAYLNYYLCGDYVADMSDSAGTSWLDVGQRDWSDHLLQHTKMRRDQMPRLVEGTEKAGLLRADLAAKWGLSNPVTIAGGAGDNAAAACGIGALKEGQGFVSLGTSGVVLAARNGYFPAPETAVHTFCHAVPERWYQMGVMLAATDSLNWLAQITGHSAAELTSALGNTLRPPEKLRFLPYLSGERTPHNDSSIRGSFIGLSANTTREDMTRAVLEGVAFALRDNFDALQATGAKLSHLFAIGGGTASQYWLQIIATTLGIPLHLPKGREFGAALGAARLGIAATTNKKIQEIMQPPEISETIDPIPAHQPSFETAYRAFKNTYPAIKEIQ